MLEIKNVFVDFDRPILNDINFNAKNTVDAFKYIPDLF